MHLEWEGSSTTGLITDLSFGGALIKQVNGLPAQGTSVAIKLEFNENEVQLNGKLAARILRTVHQLSEEGEGMVWIGVHFEESEEVTQIQTGPGPAGSFP